MSSQPLAKKGIKLLLGTTEPSRKAFEEYSHGIRGPVNERRKGANTGVDDDVKSIDEEEKKKLAEVLAAGASPSADRTPVTPTTPSPPRSPTVPLWMQGSPDRFVEPATPLSSQRKRGGLYGNVAFESLGSMAGVGERGEAVEQEVEGPAMATATRTMSTATTATMSTLGEESNHDMEMEGGREREQMVEEREEKETGCWAALCGCFRK